MNFAGMIAAAIHAEDLGPVTLVTSSEALDQPATQAIARSGIFRDVAIVESQGVPRPLEHLLPILRRWSHEPRRVQVGDKWLRQTVLAEYTEKLGRQTAALLAYFREAGGSDRFRAVFIPYIDRAKFIPLGFWRNPFGVTEFAGIAINPRCHFRPMGIAVDERLRDDRIEALSFRRLIRHRRLGALFSIDPYFVRYCANDRVRHVPEPARRASPPVPGALRRRLGISSSAIVLLLYGDLGSRRKTQAEAIRALADPRIPASVVLIAAGRRQHPDVEHLPEPETSLLRAAGRFIELNRFIEDEWEDALFDAADIVWACYRDHTAHSNVLTKAGLWGKPVAACRQGLIGQLVRDAGCGICASPDSHDEMVEALQALASDQPLRSRLGAAARGAFEANDAAAFTEPILAWLRTLRP